MSLKTKLLLVVTIILSGAGCQSYEPIRTMSYVDLTRFAGDWYVLASIPTFIEKEAYAAVESYSEPVNGRVATTFRFRKGGFDGPEKVYNPTGFVREDTGNAVWGMQFIWPVKAEYRILYVDDDYRFSIVGRSKRDYVWIMARSADVSEADYEALISIVEAEGYNLSQLRRVPHPEVDRIAG